MPRIIRRILATLAVGIAFVAAFLVVKEIKTSLFRQSQSSMEDAGEAVSATTEKQIKLAQGNATQNKSATEILVDKARTDVITTLDATKTDKDKRIAASNFFFGAYFLNTRTRAEYCASRGIKIDSFVAAYKLQNRDLFVSAEKYQIEDLRDHGYTYDIDQLYKMMLPALQKYLAQDMKDIASMMKISESEVCQSLEENAAMWADNMDYRKRVPDGAQLLLKNIRYPARRICPPELNDTGQLPNSLPLPFAASRLNAVRRFTLQWRDFSRR